MIEAGLAIIATCLPTLQALFVRSSLQSMVASVRSIISLQSMRSHSSRGSKRSHVGVDTQAEDTIALRDIDENPSLREPDSVHLEPKAARYDRNDSAV